uniref:Uncharacterized protein n=1 Tax=Gallus gallus TaxID=9031 RepID=A0A8V0Z7X2_CHICK
MEAEIAQRPRADGLRSARCAAQMCSQLGPAVPPGSVLRHAWTGHEAVCMGWEGTSMGSAPALLEAAGAAP